ncbi:MAG: DUF3597 domain-containing protein [Methylococcaceae bacterium]|nr:DUF3597 domain-containing protein [Methylococcaceae bacterium]
MSIFSSILSKLGIGKAEAAEAPAATAGTSTAPVSTVDVLAKLEGLAAAHAEKLNWKTSIVDLLKVLGLDSSLTARKELGKELGYPGSVEGDSAALNIWLHKTVLQKLAENGGNIPPELLG